MAPTAAMPAPGRWRTAPLSPIVDRGRDARPLTQPGRSRLEDDADRRPHDPGRALVWQAMLAPDTCRAWTAAFCESSHGPGCWKPGTTIRFQAPSGDGMVAEIAGHRPQVFGSIRHQGDVVQRVQDSTRDKVRAWVRPARATPAPTRAAAPA